ncbi:MAG: ATP-dependent protease LonB [Candidatus Nanoarchaeia archaeon]|nr:ATP-dependent protease LonB [Candidatus Nanoarchaeia archaeon]MDD5499838.1 ATP-dependent protease LonB [Candidatus Nanoarchaeia archaeon]
MKEDYPELDFKTTDDIKINTQIIDQVIGQDKAVAIIKKAAKQRRNIILIGEPGTGKSMLGLALSELLPKTELEDVLCIPNQKDENNPKIKVVKAGDGNKIISSIPNVGQDLLSGEANSNYMIFIAFGIIALIYMALNHFVLSKESDVLQAANRISFTIFITLFLLGVISILSLSKSLAQRMVKVVKPKLLIDNSLKDKAPFVDATGTHEGALLGDVRHDPFQSGGLGTPAHERVEVGAIHRAHKGVLFMDEIAVLNQESQVNLLTAMQEKKLAITGRSERSAGAMVKTDPVPCDFVLVAAGNTENFFKHMNPALRSRIRGYGYEVYINDMMENNSENRKKFAQFIAQEIKNEKGRIPKMSKEGVIEVIKEAHKRSGRKNKLTLKLREIGGLIRVAGDIAIDENAKIITAEHIEKAKKLSSSLEKQIVEEAIERNREYSIIKNTGAEIGIVNGLAIMGSDAGIVMPIEAAVTPTSKEGSSEVIATGKLGEIAKEAVKNVFAVIKKYRGEDVKKKYDTHIQFVMSYSGVEGDSASISIATAVISALENLPIRQDTAMTGSLTVRGEVTPIGGINSKLEAAIEAGMKRVIVPKLNMQDIIPSLRNDGLKILPAENISDVLEHALSESKNKKIIIDKLKKILK